MKSVMRHSRFEEFTNLLFSSAGTASLLIIFTIIMLIIGNIMFAFLKHIGSYTSLEFAPMYLLLGIITWLNISMAIIISVIRIKMGIERYDEYTNKEWTNKDMDRWCHCSFGIQHKLIIHKNDPKFFIQNEK